MNKRLLLGSVGSLVVKIANILIVFFTTLVLARWMGPEGFGTYAHAYAILLLLGVPTQAGIPALAVREVAKYQLTENWSCMRGFLRRSFQTTLVLSIIIASSAAAFVSWYEPKFTKGHLDTYLIAFALLPLIALGNLRGAIMRGLRNIVIGQVPESVLRPAFLLLLIFIVASFSESALYPGQVMVLHVTAAAIAFSVGAWLLVKSSPPQLKGPVISFESKRWAASIVPLSFISGMDVVLKQTDMIMLGVLGSAQDVGVYRVVVQCTFVVSIGLQAVSLAFAPYIARQNLEGDRGKLQDMVRLSARWSAITAFPVALSFALAGSEILGGVFGESYSTGALPLAILSLSQLINTMTGPLSVLLNMTGHERATAKGLTLAALINVVLNLFLIPPYGMAGAAIASSVSILAWNFALWRSAYALLGINCFLIKTRSNTRESGPTDAAVE
jgi:O-antigen/teichoic acid export membrane protein